VLLRDPSLKTNQERAASHILEQIKKDPQSPPPTNQHPFTTMGMVKNETSGSMFEER